jgi:hypothetical protein
LKSCDGIKTYSFDKEHDMKKTTKPEMITLAELARLAGVSQVAAGAFVRRQEEAGAPLVTLAGRRTKTVDKNNPLIRAYIDNKTGQPVNRSGGRKPPGEAALAKLAAQTEKAELSAAALRARYISRTEALAYLDELLETEKKTLIEMVGRIIEGLTKEFGPVSRAKLREVRRILEQPCGDVITMTRREIEKFRRDTDPRITGPGNPAAGGKHGKNNPLPRQP